MDDKNEAEALSFWDSTLPVRVDRRITGANGHDARSWLHKYGNACGAFNYKDGVSVSNAKWYRDVLTIFANGKADSIADAQRLHMSAVKAMTAEAQVKAKWPHAQACWTSRGWRIFANEAPGLGVQILGKTSSGHAPESEAWSDAASRLRDYPDAHA